MNNPFKSIEQSIQTPIMATYPQDKPINYREVYFTHATLRTINRNSTYADIQHMYK